MSLFFALMLIGLPAAALFYDFRNGDYNTAFAPRGTGNNRTE